jgi:hypothetical protein
MHLTVERVAADRLGTEHLDACEAACPLPVHERWVCGDWEDAPGGSAFLVSGLSSRVGGGPFASLAEATGAAVEFLSRHVATLAVFRRHASVSELRLWIPVAVSDEEAQRWRLPKRLAHAGEQGG